MFKVTKARLIKEKVEHVILDRAVYFSIESVKDKISDIKINLDKAKVIFDKKYVRVKDIIPHTDFDKTIRLSLSFKNHSKYGFRQ